MTASGEGEGRQTKKGREERTSDIKYRSVDYAGKFRISRQHTAYDSLQHPPGDIFWISDLYHPGWYTVVYQLDS